jgi:YfiH family protein
MTCVYWRRDLPAEPGRVGAVLAFTSRRGGSSPAPWDGLNLGGATGDDAARVQANRAVVAADLGVAGDHLLFMDQMHGADVAVVDGPGRAAGEQPVAADAIVTRHTGLALAALVADCVPVLLLDRSAGVAGAVHAGRPGLVAGVVQAAVEAMGRLGADSERIEAAVGPSVCGRCYEVPETMRAEVAAVSPVSATVSWTGTPAVDVAAGVVDVLHRAGAAVTWVPGCTREDPDLYSYRRDGRTGRFAGVVRLVPADGISVR